MVAVVRVSQTWKNVIASKTKLPTPWNKPKHSRSGSRDKKDKKNKKHKKKKNKKDQSVSYVSVTSQVQKHQIIVM